MKAVSACFTTQHTKSSFCVICEFAVDPKSPYGHVKHRHSGLKSKADIFEKFRQILPLLLEDEVQILAPGQPIIPHILLSPTAIDEVLGETVYFTIFIAILRGKWVNLAPLADAKTHKGMGCQKTWCLFL